MISESERRALVKAIRTNAAAQVRRLEHGLYEVPSATQPGVTYIVCGVAMDGSDHTCTCPAGEHGRACYHIAAVRLRRVQEEAKRAYRQYRQYREEAEAASSASPGLAPLAVVPPGTGVRLAVQVAA
ncbi:MAG: SWIM zinc finger family protein [Chloroflexota bacterium]